MAEITASLVKALRDKTGAGMMDCKAALTETGGDMEQAVDWLRKKGLSKAAKKADRVAADGLIGVTVQAQDRVRSSRSTRRPTSSPATPSSRSWCAPSPRWRRRPRATWRSCWRWPIPARASSVDEHVKAMIATIGENMSMRRTAAVSVGGRGRRRLRAQQGRRRARQDRRAGGAREQGRQGGAGRLGPAASPCTSPRRARPP